MEKNDDFYITLKGEDGDVIVEVLEQTVVNGITYVLVVEKNDSDSEFENCFILKDVSLESEKEGNYETIEDEKEFEEIGEIFKKILLHDDIVLTNDSEVGSE